MGGAFQTSRDIFQNPIWQDIPKFRIFFYIIGNAVFSKEGVNIGDIHVKRGQYLRSYRNLADDLQYIENRKVKKYSVSVISRKIDQLVKEKRLKIESTELGTLFTVVNYDKYQLLSNYKNEPGTELEQSWNSDGTELEQSWNNNKKDKKVNKDKEEEEEEEKKDENIFSFFERNGGLLSPYTADLIGEWLDDPFFNDPSGSVMAAMKETVKQGVHITKWKYTEAILNDWKTKGLKTLEQINEHIRTREGQIDNAQHSRRNGRTTKAGRTNGGASEPQPGTRKFIKTV